VNFNSKWIVNSFFFKFLRAPICSHMAKSVQVLKSKVLKKKKKLSIESEIFTIFHVFLKVFVMLMVLHNIIFNMTILI
jgi:hypothetical protein